jgi:plastocyanin
MPFREHVILIHEEAVSQRTKIRPTQDLHVCPHELKVHKGDTVRWLYNKLDQFECVFERDSPFGKDHKVIEGLNGSSPALAVTADVGNFSYTVDERHLEKDPIIIVDPSIPK